MREPAGPIPHNETGRPILRVITIGGTSFEVTMHEDAAHKACHWIPTAPGRLALGGNADSEKQALDDAYGAAGALVELKAA